MGSTNGAAKRLISAGSAPDVLGVVVVESAIDLSEALFDVLAHAAAGADGIDLTVGASASPAEQLAVADQLADAAHVAVHLRSDRPLAAGAHSVVLPARTGRLRPSARVLFDIEVDRLGGAPNADVVKSSWPNEESDRPLLLATAGFSELSTSQLIGLASIAADLGFAAVSTNDVRTVRRAVDTLAPLTPRTRNGSVDPCL